MKTTIAKASPTDWGCAHLLVSSTPKTCRRPGLRLLVLAFCLSFATHGLAQLPSPGDLQLWLKADMGVQTSGSSVTNWLDQSGNGNNATPDSPTQQPTLTLSALNGLPVLTLDGINDSLTVADVPALDGSAGLTIFMVGGQASQGTYDSLIGKWDPVSSPDGGSYLFEIQPSGKPWGFIVNSAGDGGSNYRQADTVVVAQPQIFKILYDGSQGTDADRLKFFSDGTDLGDGGGGGTITNSLRDSQSPLTIGDFRNISSRAFHGDIAEVIVYNTVLSAGDQLTVENYLNNKYFIPEPSAFWLLAVSMLWMWRRRVGMR